MALGRALILACKGAIVQLLNVQSSSRFVTSHGRFFAAARLRREYLDSRSAWSGLNFACVVLAEGMSRIILTKKDFSFLSDDHRETHLGCAVSVGGGS